MMMQMLKAGGIAPITDGLRTADISNAKGYFEHESVKDLPQGNYSCLEGAQGKAIKVISTLLEHLPEDCQYKIIFMNRAMDEILASQKAMLKSLDSKAIQDNDFHLRRRYQSHLKQTSQWMFQQSNIDVLYLSYDDLIQSPKLHVNFLMDFLGARLNHKRMVKVVDQTMRNHSQ